MKKIVCILTLIALTLSLFGCRKMPEEIDSKEIPTHIKDEPLKENNDVEVPEQTAETDEKSTDTYELANPDQNNVHFIPDENTPEQEEAFDSKEDYKPQSFTIDDYFQPYEIAVTLTAKESAINKKYTVTDFAYLDLIYVYEYSEYYPEKYYPHLKDNKTLFLVLEWPDKKTVLNYCETLEQDGRVSFARPNIQPYGTQPDGLDRDTYRKNMLLCTYYKTNTNENLYKQMLKEMRSNSKLILEKVSNSNPENEEVNDGKLTSTMIYLDMAQPVHVNNMLEIAAKYDFYENLRPAFINVDDTSLRVLMTPERKELGTKLSALEFENYPDLGIKEITEQQYYNKYSFINFETPDKHTVIKAYKQLQDCDFLQKVELNTANELDGTFEEHDYTKDPLQNSNIIFAP